MVQETSSPHFVTLGMFIIDEFEYLDEEGRNIRTHNQLFEPQIGGGGTYAAIGARLWLPPQKIGMIVDRGHDFPDNLQASLEHFGSDMWLFRDEPHRLTTRAMNSYRGDHRGFRYLTLRQRLTPSDLHGTKFEDPATLHFICSPTRALTIVQGIQAKPEWRPLTIYEPIPDKCIPEEMPSLIKVLPQIDILSPNADEALALLGIPGPASKPLVERACTSFLDLGVGPNGLGHVVVRSGELGAYVACRARPGLWVDAFWTTADADKVVDVTGAGNSFLGGLSAGLKLSGNDVYEAVLYASVSASFIIEQPGLPRLTFEQHESGADVEAWNGDSPLRRLGTLRRRCCA